jgi:GTP diphosphokinase / guanosine-3',5'-bis(diphosphate) 3'-diphosphatase
VSQTISPEQLWQTLEPKLGYLPPAERALVREALGFAYEAHQHQKRKSGEPYIIHPVAVASILASLNLDPETLIAGLLHDTIEDTDTSPEAIGQRFGVAVRRIVEGETKVSKLYKLAHGQGVQSQLVEEKHAEDLRQMFIAMAEDVRIIIVKLADRLHNLRTLEFMPPHKQKRIAQETLEIYAPLAHRLGIGQVKLELEDLSFRYLEPEEYKSLELRLKSHDHERDTAVHNAAEALEQALGRDSILQQITQRIEVMGRTKHLYSIWKKMEREEKALEQIYDLLALRVILDPKPGQPEDALVREKQVCYHVLGLVHAYWQPIPGRVKDYIAVPKPNGYQSLHTTVIAVNGLPLEVQIRTREMHQIAEYGIAAHWLYKEGITDPEDLKKRMSWLKSIQEWQQEYSSSRDFVEAVTKELLGDRVFVFTPKGKIINLPKGASPVDFAYHIHTEVGHHMVGAKVNSRIVPLSYELQNGEIVEILTAKTAHPSKDWVEYAKTRSAKQKVRIFFRASQRSETLEKGQKMLERYFKRRGLSKPLESQLESIGRRLINSAAPEDIYAALAVGRIVPGQIARALAPKPEPAQKPKLPKNELGIRLEADLAVPIKLASCCAPTKGDTILGYVTRGRGVTIHKAECANMRRLMEQDPGRVVVSYWQGLGRVVQLDVIAEDRAGLLRDVMEAIASMGKSAMGVNSKPVFLGSTQFRISTRVELNEREQAQMDERIRQVTNVREVRWS